MPRPVKCRRICKMPKTREFASQCGKREGKQIVLLLDEYEAIRLIDAEGLSQEEAAARMNVARTTAQMIYNNARKKLAAFLLEGQSLRIEGGNIEMCKGRNSCCNKNRCHI